jgi:nucleoid DNA-binding protein
MTKKEIVAKAAASAGISKSKAEVAINATLDEIAGALRSGQKVTFVGFGTFSTSHRKARMGRNPRTGATIQIAASNIPKFKAGKALKDSVN